MLSYLPPITRELTNKVSHIRHIVRYISRNYPLEIHYRGNESPFSDGGKVERRDSNLTGRSRSESLPGWHVSDTGEV